MLQVTMGLATQGLIAKYETFDKSSTAHTHQMVQTWTAED